MTDHADEAKILVCDDDIVTLSLIGQVLQDKGYTVIMVENGVEALEAFKNQGADLILMDADMPEMDGFEACKKLRAMPSVDELPIIMITTLDDDDSVNRAFDAGAAEFITKPIKWSVLYRRIRLLIKFQRDQAALRQ
ncbi:MAG: response regulator, partial [Magnetococcales bacterium]|nr:response regulator [Magnetococcales bacterium]